MTTNKAQRGAVVPLPQVWELSRRWYVDPLDPAWRPRTRDETQAVIAGAGLTGDFWELPRA